MMNAQPVQSSSILLRLLTTKAEKPLKSYEQINLKTDIPTELPINEIEWVEISSENIENNDNSPTEIDCTDIRSKNDQNSDILCDEISLENNEKDHIPPKLHLCPICLEKYTASDLRKHIQTHRTLKKYLNIPRSQRVSFRARFYSERTSLNPKNDLHKCLYCDHDFRAEEFKEHIKNHEKFRCNECCVLFRKKHHLHSHKLKSHTNRIFHRCKHCQKEFKKRNNLDIHLVKVHNLEPPYKCTLCPERFIDPLLLKHHVNLHNETKNSEKTDLKCAICSSPFQNIEDNKNHICTITFECKLCPKIYKNKQCLNYHIRSFHQGKTKPKKQCPICGIMVKNTTTHMKSHKGKTWPCKQCDLTFTLKSNLERHMLVHTGKKNFVCVYCAKAFNCFRTLQCHEMSHEKKRKLGKE